jgi:hypothetical protein
LNRPWGYESYFSRCIQRLPKNRQPFSAARQSFEQNIKHPSSYSARKITATLQQNSEWLLLGRSIPRSSFTLHHPTGAGLLRRHGRCVYRSDIRARLCGIEVWHSLSTSALVSDLINSTRSLTSGSVNASGCIRSSRYEFAFPPRL